MSEWAEARKLFLARQRSAGTRRMYELALRQFEEFVGLERATRSSVDAWIVAMRERGLADATIEGRVSALSAFYRYAMERYQVRDEDGRLRALAEQNPATGHQAHGEKYTGASYLTADELRGLFAAIDRSSVTGRRDYALLLAYALTGRRNTEIRLLRVSDLRAVEGAWVYQWTGKGKTNMAYQMPAAVVQALLAWRPALLAERGLVFPGVSGGPMCRETVNRILRRWGVVAGIEKPLHIHMLRHSWAVLSRRLGADVMTVSHQLGHSNLAVTSVYLDHMEVRPDMSEPICKLILEAK